MEASASRKQRPGTNRRSAYTHWSRVSDGALVFFEVANIIQSLAFLTVSMLTFISCQKLLYLDKVLVDYSLSVHHSQSSGNIAS